MATEQYIEVKNITKHFPGVKALSDVCFGVRKGELHAIVGENGAGKSTLMKILGGVYFADSGEICIDGAPCRFRSAEDSIKKGISVIYQELNLMPELTVAENIFVSTLPTRAGPLDTKTINTKPPELIGSLHLPCLS